MGFSSQSGQVILKTQATQGVFDPDTGTSGVAVKLRSGSLGPSRELLIPDPEIGGGRDVVDSYLGAVSWSGDLEFYARTDSLVTMLKAVLGTKTSVAGTAAGTFENTITPSDAAQLPFLSIEEKIGSGLEVFNYSDCVANTFHLEAEANGYLQGTLGIIGAKQVAGATPTATPKWDNTPMYVGTNIVITYNGVTLPAKSFSIDINNNFEDDDFRLGSFYIGDLTPKRREVTASFSIREKDSSLWRQAVYGSSTAVAPGGLVTKAPLKISMKTYENIAATTTPRQLDLEIPVFALKPYALGVSGDDVIESDVEGQALRPDPAVGIMSAKVITATDITA